MRKIGIGLIFLVAVGTASAEESPCPAPPTKPVRCTYDYGEVEAGDVVRNQPGMPKNMAMMCANIKGEGVFLLVADSSLKYVK